MSDTATATPTERILFGNGKCVLRQDDELGVVWARETDASLENAIVSLNSESISAKVDCRDVEKT